MILAMKSTLHLCHIVTSLHTLYCTHTHLKREHKSIQSRCVKCAKYQIYGTLKNPIYEIFQIS